MQKVFYSILTKVAISMVAIVLLYIFSDYLPNSPFQTYMNSNNTFLSYLKYVNYFIPLNNMIVVFELWVLAIFEYYQFRIIYKIYQSVSGEISSLSSSVTSFIGKGL